MNDFQDVSADDDQPKPALQALDKKYGSRLAVIDAILDGTETDPFAEMLFDPLVIRQRAFELRVTKVLHALTERVEKLEGIVQP